MKYLRKERGYYMKKCPKQGLIGTEDQTITLFRGSRLPLP